MSADKTLGLYGKYRVERADGSSAPGGKHERCGYFVLDLEHDPYAFDALIAYARSCNAEYPELARDLRRLIIANAEGRRAIVRELMHKLGHDTKNCPHCSTITGACPTHMCGEVYYSDGDGHVVNFDAEVAIPHTCCFEKGHEGEHGL